MAQFASPAPLTETQPSRNSLRPDLALRLRGVRVCHLTPTERGRDERAFTREALPSLAYGLRACILGPHSLSGPIKEVEFVPSPKCRSRLTRILLAARLAFWALKQDADIYHIHNPELIPAGLVLRVFFRRKVVYDTREDFPSMMLTKTYDLVYRGGLSERAGTFILLNAIRLLWNRGVAVRLLLFGYTDNAQAEQFLKDSLISYGINHLVTLRGTISHEQMASTLSLARIAVCPLQKIPKFMNNIPVKVFESWACGLPVIATDLPPIRPFFAGRKLGMLVKPGDIHGLANAICQMLAAPDLIEEYGRRARRLVVERYNTAMEIPKLLSLYERVLAC